MEKIDIHKSEIEYKKAIARLKEDVSPKNFSTIKNYLDASAIGRLKRKHNLKRMVGVRARVKNVFLFKIGAKFFDKDILKLTRGDMDKFVIALNENIIKKEDGTAYSEQTKSNLKILFISLIRFYYEPKKAAELSEWIPTNFKRKEINPLYEADIYKMLSKSFTLSQKVLVACLFDSGARIEEFLNVRIGDVTEVKDVIPYYKMTFRNEFSKTQGRTIGLFWKETTELVRQWLEQHPHKNDLDAPFFSSPYGSVRMMLFKIGKRALGRSVNPHLLRHSSATHYAGQGNDYFLICKRYGWAIGSKTPRIYIDKSGIDEKRQTEKFISENVTDLNKKLELMQREKIKEIEALKQKIENIQNLLVSNALGKTKVSQEEEGRIKKVVDMMVQNG